MRRMPGASSVPWFFARPSTVSFGFAARRGTGQERQLVDAERDGRSVALRSENVADSRRADDLDRGLHAGLRARPSGRARSVSGLARRFGGAAVALATAGTRETGRRATKERTARIGKASVSHTVTQPSFARPRKRRSLDYGLPAGDDDGHRVRGRAAQAGRGRRADERQRRLPRSATAASGAASARSASGSQGPRALPLLRGLRPTAPTARTARAAPACLACQHCVDSERCIGSAYLVRSVGCSGCTYCFGCVGLGRAGLPHPERALRPRDLLRDRPRASRASSASSSHEGRRPARGERARRGGGRAGRARSSRGLLVYLGFGRGDTDEDRAWVLGEDRGAARLRGRRRAR